MLQSNGTPSLDNVEPGVAGAFDYGRWDPKTAETLKVSAERIRDLGRGLTERIFTIGRDLDLAKALLGHGEFGPWLAAEFGWTERTAQRFLQVFTVLGAKSDTVSVLPPTAVYLLSAKSTSPAVREAIVTRIEAGERPSLAEIRSEVGTARRAVQEERNLQARVRRDHRAGRPISLPPKTRARLAAREILARFEGDRPKLAALLVDVDARTLLDALRRPVSRESDASADGIAS